MPLWEGQRMKWTTSKPTESGWYWWKGGLHFLPDLVEVYHSRTGLQCRGMLRGLLPPYWVDFLDGYWAGPIPKLED